MFSQIISTTLALSCVGPMILGLIRRHIVSLLSIHQCDVYYHGSGGSHHKGSFLGKAGFLASSYHLFLVSISCFSGAEERDITPFCFSVFCFCGTHFDCYRKCQQKTGRFISAASGAGAILAFSFWMGSIWTAIWRYGYHYELNGRASYLDCVRCWAEIHLCRILLGCFKIDVIEMGPYLLYMDGFVFFSPLSTADGMFWKLKRNCE